MFSAFLFIPLFISSPEQITARKHCRNIPASLTSYHPQTLPWRGMSRKARPGASLASEGTRKRWPLLRTWWVVAWLVSACFPEMVEYFLRQNKTSFLLTARSVGWEEQKKIANNVRTLWWWTFWSSGHNHFLDYDKNPLLSENLICKGFTLWE